MATDQLRRNLSDVLPAGAVACPEGARLIPLTQGRFAIVDEADYDWLTQWPWHAAWLKRHWYATRRVRGLPRVLMHRLILGLPDGIIDHINGDGLDNRRCNLRLATNAQNLWNCRPHSDSVIPLKGVSIDPTSKRNPFVARICVHGRVYRLGHFPTPEEAGLAYDRAATRFYGEFARLNYPNKAALSHAPNRVAGERACHGTSGDIC